MSMSAEGAIVSTTIGMRYCIGKLLLVVLAGLAPQPATALLLNDGGTHIISDATYTGDTIYVRNANCGSSLDPRASCASPGVPTDLSVTSGATVGQLEARDSSTIDMSGGTINTFVDSYGTSQVTISGGLVTYSASANDTSTFEISGGNLPYGIWVYGEANFTLTGGLLNSLDTYGSSKATLRGGSIYVLLWSHENSTIEVVGSGFQVDGTPVGEGPLLATSGVLSGTLENGNAINNSFYVYDSSSIVLVPEPDTVVLGVTALLGLGLLSVRRAHS